ncbi:MAG: oxidoreductase [Deltaproteobacteria bacterium]
MTKIHPPQTFRIGDRGDRTVHRLGYGAMQLAGPGVLGPPKDRAAAIAVLRKAVELGVDHIDTSDIYGPHVTNQLIREALQPYPAELLIATKVGARRGPGGSWESACTADDIAEQVHDNLKNLALETLELVYLRAMFDPQRPSEGSLEAPLAALVKLQEQGKVGHIGLSNVTPKQVEDARAMAEVVAVQNHYNLIHRVDDAWIDDLAEAKIAYVPFFPLGGFTPIQSEQLSQVAESVGATPHQVALAWLLRRASNVLLIPGTASVEHLRENLAASTLVLPSDALTRLDALS